MAIAKVILNGEVQMDVTSDTVEANKLLEGETATKNDGTKVTGTFVAPDPVISSLSVTPTESIQTFDEASISGYKPVTVEAIASDYVGSAVPMRSDVNLTGLETYSGYKVQAQQGYYSQTASYNISAASINISGPYFTYSLGYFSGAVNIITSGYTKQRSYSFSQQLSTLSSQTITPSSESQYIPANRWLTGSQTIAPINITSLSVTPTEEQQVFNETAKSLVQTGSSVAGSTERPTLSLVVGKQYILRLIDATATNGYSCIDSIDEKEYTFTWAGQEITHRFQGYGSNRISIRITEKNTIFISSYSGIDDISWELYVENMVDGYLPVTVNAIPSSYIIPSGTYSVTENGTYDIGSYASVDVSVAGGGGSWPNDTRLSTFNLYQQPSSSHTFSTLVSNGDLVAVTGYIASISGGLAFYQNIFNDEWIWDGNEHTVNVESYAFDGRSHIGGEFVVTSSNIRITSWSGGQTTMNILGSFNKREHDSEYLAFLNKCIYGYYSNSKITAIPDNHFRSHILISNISMDNVSTIGASAFADCEYLEKATFLNASIINYSAFMSCTNLRKVVFPNCITIRSSAFYNLSALSSVDISNVINIGASAFYSCTSLTEIYAPECNTVGNAAFQSCTKLSSVYIPKCSFIMASAFRSCSSLASITLDRCTTVGSYAFVGTKIQNVQISAIYDISQCAFSYCSALSYVSIPFVSALYNSAFAVCASLQTVYVPTVSIIAPWAFYNNYSLSKFDGGQHVRDIGSYAFGYCSSLTRFAIAGNNNYMTIGSGAFMSCVNLSEFYVVGNYRLSIGTTNLSQSAFRQCSSLFSVYLLGGTVVSLASTNAFASTPISEAVNGVYGSIYVLESLYSSYIASTNWSAYADRIVSLTTTEIDSITSSLSWLSPIGFINNGDTNRYGSFDIVWYGLANRRLSDMVGHTATFMLYPVANPGDASQAIVSSYPLFTSMMIPSTAFNLSFTYSPGTYRCSYSISLNFSEMRCSYSVYGTLYGWILQWVLND